MKAHFLYLLLLILSLSLLAACGGGEDIKPTLDPTSPAGIGQELFESNCASCHRISGEQKLVGPSLAGIAKRAGSREEGVTAEDYLRESILDPDKFVVEGYKEGTMQQNFASRLSGEEVDYLVAYLLTLT